MESTAVAATPDQEIALLGTVPLDRRAVIGKDFSDRTADLPEGTDAPEEAAPAQIASSDRPEEGLPENDVIALTEYAPNALRYHYKAARERLAVFSEVYYPGWNGYLVDEDAGKEVMVPFAPMGDDVSVEILRADWTLRAALLPAGEHDLVVRFEPTSYRTGARVSRASSILLILLVLASLAGMVLTPKKP